MEHLDLGFPPSLFTAWNEILLRIKEVAKSKRLMIINTIKEGKKTVT